MILIFYVSVAKAESALRLVVGGARVRTAVKLQRSSAKRLPMCSFSRLNLAISPSIKEGFTPTSVAVLKGSATQPLLRSLETIYDAVDTHAPFVGKGFTLSLESLGVSFADGRPPLMVVWLV